MATNKSRKFEELKKKFTALPPAERVAEEIRLARELGITVTVDQVVSIRVPSENRTRLAPPSHIGNVSFPLAQGLSGAPASGLGGLVTKLPDLDRKALSAMIDADLAQLADPDREHRLGRLSEHLNLLDALDPSRKASVAIRKRIGEAVFGNIKFKSDGKYPGGGVPPSESKAQKSK